MKSIRGVKRGVMKLSKYDGGMSIPDIGINNDSLKIAWVQRIMKGNNSWNIMIQKYVPVNLDSLWHLNMNLADMTIMIAHMPNQFMKEVLMGWSRYNFHNPTNIHKIRNQVIWFNSHVRVDNCTIFLRALYAANIMYVHQFFDERGDILSLPNFQLKYGIQINFLTYYSVLSAIPQRWKVEIKEHHTIVDVPFIHMPLSNLEKKDHVCKVVYGDLIQQAYGGTIATGFRKWNDWLPGGLQMEVWQYGFRIMYTTLQCTKTLLVQFKILHFITATRAKLFLWDIVDDDLCSFCNEAIETLPHLLIECEAVKLFWNDLKHWLFLKSGILFQPTVSEIIIGFQNPDLMFNAVYLLAKRYLCRCSTAQEFPSIRIFKIFLKDFLTVEENIALKNNKLNTFINIWDTIWPYQD